MLGGAVLRFLVVRVADATGSGLEQAADDGGPHARPGQWPDGLRAGAANAFKAFRDVKLR